MLDRIRALMRAPLKHGLHPPLTDFPLALWGLLAVWDVAALWYGAPWWRVGFWTLVLSLIAAVLAATTGLIESRRVPNENDAQRTLNIHMLMMGTAVTIFIGNAIVRGGTESLSGTTAALAFATTLAGNAVAFSGAWFGGEMVFQHRVGVAAGDEPATKRERSPITLNSAKPSRDVPSKIQS